MKASEILCVATKVFKVERGRVTRNQTLKFNHRKERKPIKVYDTAKASNKGGCLFADLRVHSKESHRVNVVDSV